MEDIVVIEFTQELLDEWTKLYFKEHPRSRKKPLETPAQPSLNKWIILMRIAMNKMKQDYKSFVEFVVRENGLNDLGISECKCRYITYRKSKGRIDLDNTTPKFILDGLTAEASGVLVDDSSTCITELTLLDEYRKGIKGARIEFYDCKYDVSKLKEERLREQIKSSKKKKTMDSKKKRKK